MELAFRPERVQYVPIPVWPNRITKYYDDARFPIELRMFAEIVLGRGPGDLSSTVLRQNMVRVEAGEDFIYARIVGTEPMYFAPRCFSNGNI